jgi:hypothetical protein
LGKAYPEEPDDSVQDDPNCALILDRSRRIALGVVALPLGLLGGWMFWIVHTFLNGGGWLDLIVGVVLDEFILAVVLFALVLLRGAVFAPHWLSRAFTAAYQNLTWAIALVGILFGAAALIVFVVGPMLVRLGIVE